MLTEKALKSIDKIFLVKATSTAAGRIVLSKEFVGMGILLELVSGPLELKPSFPNSVTLKEAIAREYVVSLNAHCGIVCLPNCLVGARVKIKRIIEHFERKELVSDLNWAAKRRG